jgi:phosphatidylglycerophosphate synthase
MSSGEQPATRKQTIVAGVIATVTGLYFMLVSSHLFFSGLLDPNAAPWVVFCVGLAFLLAGVAILLQSGGHIGDSGELPADAPQWMRVVHCMLVLTIFCCFGAIGSWVAFGPGLREFSGSFMGAEGPVNDMTGRVAFGIGAVIVWICTIVMAVSGARKLLRRTDP